MEITTQIMKRAAVVYVSGRVDSNTAPEFEAQLNRLVSAGHKGLIIDMSKVEYLSSAGVRTLVSKLKELRASGGELVLADPSSRVDEVLNLAGLTSIFTIAPDVLSAVGNL
jgi:anti-sigma B factor antagonist